jgi:hypothetical protein
LGLWPGQWLNHPAKKFFIALAEKLKQVNLWGFLQ